MLCVVLYYVVSHCIEGASARYTLGLEGCLAYSHVRVKKKKHVNETN